MLIFLPPVSRVGQLPYLLRTHKDTRGGPGDIAGSAGLNKPCASLMGSQLPAPISAPHPDRAPLGCGGVWLHCFLYPHRSKRNAKHTLS